MTIAGRLRFALLFLCVALPWSAASAQGASSRPNVLFIFSDQHRMASFPGEPHTSAIAPNLARLAQQGTLWRTAIANYPVCSPYRAMLLSGRSPYRTGVIDNGITL